MIMMDMPKLESPFVRDPVTHLVTPLIAEGFEWVFDHPETQAVEKLDGTNVSVYVESGSLIAMRNRTTPIPCDNLASNRFLDGMRYTFERGWFPVSTGQHFGELMGPKIQSNYLELTRPLWFPFEYLKKAASYKAWKRIEHDFDTISNWFQNDIFSLLWKNKGVTKQPEGVVFYHPDGRMAKLRLDMFEWHKGNIRR